jgi:Leucine-rich repeat (LRR) protein
MFVTISLIYVTIFFDNIITDKFDVIVYILTDAELIIDCHDKILGINEDWFNFDFHALNQHQPLNELILSKNNMTLLPINELRNLNHLKRLDLSQNQLDNTHSEILKTLINLEDLNYSHNLLWSFDISILNINLSKLNLSHNRINNLEKSSENTTVVLKVLDVSHNNITDLVP